MSGKYYPASEKRWFVSHATPARQQAQPIKDMDVAKNLREYRRRLISKVPFQKNDAQVHRENLKKLGLGNF